MTQKRTVDCVRRRVAGLLTLTLTLSLLVASAVFSEGYYRYPDIHGDLIVFVAEGDLWTVDASGGAARRLTSHLDEELFPQIHPDGRTVAFSASYEGAREVYTMPLSGGAPERWTWEAEPSSVVGWSPSGGLVYKTTARSTLPSPLLVEIDRATEARRTLPLFEASAASFSADGTVFFARPEWHRNNTKRYQGGTARNLWRWAPGDDEATNLTVDFDGENFAPMWWEDRLYYLNDRDGTMNVWSMDRSGGDLRQHTRHSGWDVKGPSIGPTSSGGAIVYQLGADLWRLDLADDSTRRIEVQLTSDYDQLRDRWIDAPLESMTSVDVSPDGDRVVVTTRGRVFVLPARFGRQVRIAPAEGARYRSATFLPDGESILLLSDATGEQEFYVAAADGTGTPRQVTDDSSILNYGGVPSPDGTQFAATDRARNLWVIDLTSGGRRQVNDLQEGVGSVTWSPDSRWLVWERRVRNTYTELRLTDTRAPAESEAFSPGVRLTSDRVNSNSPTFGPDGKWIYFLSDRNLVSLVGSPWGPRQPEPYFDASWKVYQLALQRELRPTFRLPDETMAQDPEKDAEPEEEEGEEEAEEVEDESDEVPSVVIDTEGIADRVWALPIDPGNYRGLATNGKALFFTARDSGPSPKTRLAAVALDVEALEGDTVPLETVAEDVRSFALSDDRKKLLVSRRGSLHVVPAKAAAADLGKTQVPTSNFRFAISQREDYRQLFIDAWRLERDFFYDPNMHGVDWEGVRDKYLPLVDRVTTRAELSDLIGEVVGELSALHISVGGGDEREAQDQIAVPTLGARIRKDADGFVIEHIYRTDPDMPEWRGPLADPYLDVEVGDVIVAVNGRDAASARQIGDLLRGQAGKQVLIDLSDGSTGAQRQIVVVPTTNERELRYQDWELERRLRTDDLGDGKIGYVHLRAMGSRNLSEWYRNFYPVANRQGLIIDARHNRGGNIDSIILEKLMRQAWFYWAPRNGEPYWNMQYAFRGHMVVLVNAQTASDGEAFAEGFRRLGLGKVIGKRTWGGEIWLSSNNRLSDGGIARAPQTGVYADGEWLIEGWGVEPDIEVDNLPRETFDGRDRQLETAVEVLLRAIEEDPRLVPEPPAYPDKSFEYPEADGSV